MHDVEITVGQLNELDDPGCREFSIGEGDWPFRGFVIRKDDEVNAGAATKADYLRIPGLQCLKVHS